MLMIYRILICLMLAIMPARAQIIDNGGGAGGGGGGAGCSVAAGCTFLGPVKVDAVFTAAVSAAIGNGTTNNTLTITPGSVAGSNITIAQSGSGGLQINPPVTLTGLLIATANMTDGQNSGTADAIFNLRTGVGHSTTIKFFLNSTANWIINNSSASVFNLEAFNPSTGVFTGNVIGALPFSGALSDGKPYFSGLSPWSMTAGRTIVPNDWIATDIEMATSDIGKTTTLGTDPLTTTSGSRNISVAWTGCCANTGLGQLVQTFSSGSDTWVLIAGAAAVNGLTPNGWMQVTSITNANTFVVACPTTICAGTASGNGSGGGASVTARSSSTSHLTNTYSVTQTGAGGFPGQQTNYWVAQPEFFIPTGNSQSAAYEHFFNQSYSPNDTTGTNQWLFTGIEWDFFNRGPDSGYQPDAGSATNYTAGMFLGAPAGINSGVVPSPQGTVQNFNTIISLFGKNGRNGFYDGFVVGRNALVSAVNDPSAHGGVGIDIFEALNTPGAGAYCTTNASAVVTISVGSGATSIQINGGTWHQGVAVTTHGVTIAIGDYVMSNVNTSNDTFQITASSGTGDGSCGGSASTYGWFANLKPYAPYQAWGGGKHGITFTDFASDDGSLLFFNGSASATLGVTDDGAGNVGWKLTPAGTGSVNLIGTLTTAPIIINATGGTTLPPPITNTILQLVSSGLANVMSNTFGGVTRFSGKRADGSVGSPSAVQLDDALTTFAGFGYGTTGYSAASRGNFSVVAGEAAGWTDSAQGAYLRFDTTAIGGTTTSERMRIDAAGHLLSKGTAPTVGSGVGDCGTSPAIVGNDVVGRITVGSSTNGAKCTVTFATTWTSQAPICSVQNETSGARMVWPNSPGVSTLAITAVSVLTAGDTLSYTCRNYN